MKLRYIHIEYAVDFSGSDYFTWVLAFHCNFIGNYVSKEIRKMKIETDGTYNHIIAKLSKENEMSYNKRPVDSLEIKFPFDSSLYLKMSQMEKYEFYISVMSITYKYIAEIKGLPMNAVTTICDRFRANGYKNEWVHKKKFIKEYGVNVILNCYLTSRAFRLELILIRKKDKVILAQGDVFQTAPNEVFFMKDYRDILIEGDNISITDFLDRPHFQLPMQDLLKGDFKVLFLGDYEIYPPLSDEQLKILFEN